MVLKHIELINFRLHEKTLLDFSDNLNFIVGGNGQGKTTILEAIYYLCTTRSMSLSPETEAVNFAKDFFEIKGKFKDLSENDTRLYYEKAAGKKYFFLDDKQIYRASSIIGKFPVVALIQSDHSITLGSPGDRRKFVDSVISQASETYLKILLEYNKTLRQRSALLTQIKETNDRSLLNQMEAWTNSLINIGSEIIKHRIAFVQDFRRYVNEAYNKIMNTAELPDIEYDFCGETDPENIRETFEKQLSEVRNDELRRAVNLVGPHRDDFIFKVNGLDLKKYGSQGQHKTFQIALRFAQFFYIKDAVAKTPVFLMDDVFGELDTYRAQKISEYLKEIGQAFVTMTDFTKYDKLRISDTDLLINVNNGEAVYA